MISQEPIVRVGLLEHTAIVRGKFEGTYELNEGVSHEGGFEVRNDHGMIVMSDEGGNARVRSADIVCRASGGAHCRIDNIQIGKNFHWERKEDQLFGGNFVFRPHHDETLMVINEIPLEEYLLSVISSEMSASAPSEFLQAHAVISRSWLVAMMEKGREKARSAAHRTAQKKGEIMRWYGREDHFDYDVCADDHCQRYHGIHRIRPGGVPDAIHWSRGKFLVYRGEICDTRYSKSCGGRTENFESVWDNTPIPYLISVSDSSLSRAPLITEKESNDWIISVPDAYCHTNDESILRQILPSFDQETRDFYRWQVCYEREDLENTLFEKSGVDFGTLMDLSPVERGPSGRIIRLQITGTRQTMIVGKELEIRRWLSPTHLKSSAFVVETERNNKGIPRRFVLKGAGWGHGVGLCQIGAAVMAMHGMNAEKILRHYYHGVSIQKLY